MAMKTVKVQAADLEKMIVKRLTEVGLKAEEAATVADVLVYAELRGVASHGVVRVEHYCNRIRAGGINLNPNLKIEYVKPNIGRIDAKGCMGHLASVLVTREGIDVAKKQGMALMGILNSSHNGALAYYAQMALDARMAAMICVNTDPLVAPFGGRFSFTGSNPLCFAFPGRKEDLLMDMATSQIAWGKVITHRLSGEPLAPGLVQDASGNPTTDATKAVSLTAFGGVKGWGINLMVEMFTGLLVGGAFGPHVRKMYEGLDIYRNISNFVLLIDPSIFYGGTDAYLDVAQNMFDEIHAQPPTEGFKQVLIPGEIERMNIAKNEAEGISVPKEIYDFLAK